MRADADNDDMGMGRRVLDDVAEHALNSCAFENIEPAWAPIAVAWQKGRHGGGCEVEVLPRRIRRGRCRVDDVICAEGLCNGGAFRREVCRDYGPAPCKA